MHLGNDSKKKTLVIPNQTDSFMDALKNRAAQNKIDRITEGAQEIIKHADAEECEIILAKARQFTDSNCPYLEYWAKDFLIKVAELRLAGLQDRMKCDSESYIPPKNLT